MKKKKPLYFQSYPGGFVVAIYKQGEPAEWVMKDGEYLNGWSKETKYA